MESHRKKGLLKYSSQLKRKETKKRKSQLVERLERHLEEKSYDTDKALDNLIYGIHCLRVLNGARTERIILTLDINDSTNLKIINLKTKRSERLKLTMFQDADLDMERGEIKKLSEKNQKLVSESAYDKNYITLLTTKRDTYDFVFFTAEDLDYFAIAFLFVLNLNFNDEEDDLNEKFIDSIRSIWMKYDSNFSGKLDMDEFVSFAKELNLLLNKSFSVTDLFKSIDKDNSKTIDFDEFIDYYKKFTNGEELKFIFDKYSKYNEFFRENTISPQNLMLFFSEIQKENLEETDAKILILLIKKTIPEAIMEEIKQKLDKTQPLTAEEDKYIHLKLDEFKILIYDKTISSVYSSASLEAIQDMDKPLTDYFIFSSHNTYLTGHQVYGGSDPEMYSSALLIGCRLVELDVYNGGPEGPVVKHGFTMTGEILLRDALENIRKSAFVVSEYPVILSIENHCNEDNQIKMANLFKEILVDLFIIEDDTDMIKYPSPNKLRRKFIIKAKRKEIYAKIPDGKRQTEGLNEKKTIINLPGGNRNNLKKFENSMSSNAVRIFKENANPNLAVNNSKLQPVTENKVSKIINSSAQVNKSQMDNSYLNYSQNIKLENLNNRNTLFKSPPEEANDANSKHFKLNEDLEKNEIEAQKIGKEALKQKKQNAPMISKLSQTIGMIGRKLHLDKMNEMNYQFWDCVTKKDNYLIAKTADFSSRKKIVDYCKGSFLKAYPTNFSSENYDCIKTWMTGCQISAVNIQKLDCDYFLLNLVFFRQNEKYGLVLKPKHLRDRTAEYSEQYLAPKKKLNITLISGYMLNLLGFDDETNKFKINLKNLRMEIKLVGSLQDDNQKNNKFEISIEQNLLNPHFNNVTHSLDIYETDLSAVFIYIYSDKEIIGRSIIPMCMLAEGLRCVPIYDIKADEFNESRLVFKFECVDV